MKRKQTMSLILGILLLLTSGFLFLRKELTPQATAERTFSEKANQYLRERGSDLPLILQTDSRWGSISYGSGSKDNDLATNGCAIASLSMILSYKEQRTVHPTEILRWSGNRYYADGQGTSWTIFSDFASHYGLSIENLGKDSESIQQELQKNHPLVISVIPGEFTDVGHIMVIKKDTQSENIRVYDPNDDETKQHYSKTYTLEQLMPQIANAWAYTR